MTRLQIGQIVVPALSSRPEHPEQRRTVVGVGSGRGSSSGTIPFNAKVRTPKGIKSIRVLAEQGHGGLEEIDEVGDRQFVLTPRIRTGRRGGPGAYSFHSQFRLPPFLGGGELSVQHNNTNEPDRGRYRTEHLRAIAEVDPYYDQLYGKRNRTEPHNSSLQRTLQKNWSRAHSIGAGAQLTDLLGFAIWSAPGPVELACWNPHAREQGGTACRRAIRPSSGVRSLTFWRLDEASPMSPMISASAGPASTTGVSKIGSTAVSRPA